MRPLRIFLLALAFVPCLSAYGTPKLSPADLQVLTGDRWRGTLTYLDYTSNEPVSIPSDLVVTGVAGDASSFSFEYLYPDEPKANGSKILTIDETETSLGDESVTSRSNPDATTLEIVTTKQGEDDERKALLRFTYRIQPQSFSIIKEVCLEGSSECFERHRYEWTR